MVRLALAEQQEAAVQQGDFREERALTQDPPVCPQTVLLQRAARVAVGTGEAASDEHAK